MTHTHQAYLPYIFFKCLGFFIAFYLYSSFTHATDNQLKEDELAVTPKRCVALRQGQVCYQEVTFRWHKAEIGNYCLVELSTLNNIKCWSQMKSGEVSFDFQSNKSLTYGLRKQNAQRNLSLASITVSWVFKSSKRPKSSWKLF